MSIAVSIESRLRHTYIAGRSGMGKTTLLTTLAAQDINQGRGVIFIDPDGDASEDLLRYVPKNRVKDTIYFEPTTIPIGLNAFNPKDDSDRARIADDMYTMFRRLSDNWGDRMDAILRNSLATLLRVDGSTLLDLYYLLDDDDFRARILQQIQEPELVRYWSKQFPKYPSNATEPILSRMSKFVLWPSLRTVAGSQNGIDLYDLMERRKILIVNLVHAESAGAIIGAILISQLQLAAKRRATQKIGERRPYYVYIDEFQVFQAQGFERLVGQARKLRLALTIATHFPHQIDDRLRRTILGLFGTFFCFAMGEEDARMMAGTMRVAPDHIIDLSRFHCYVRAERSPRLIKTLLPTPGCADHSAEIVAQTKKKYVAEVPTRLATTISDDPEPSE